jgi:hypothetical protein
MGCMHIFLTALEVVSVGITTNKFEHEENFVDTAHNLAF